MNQGNKELLERALEHGLIDMSSLQKSVEMKEREELLKQHPYAIWQGKTDGKWYTYFPDEKKGRVLKRRVKREDLENDIVKSLKVEIENPTIEEVFREWLVRKLKLEEIKESTYWRYEKVFERHFTEFGKNRIKDVSLLEFQEFLEEQIPEKKLDAKGFANLRAIVRGFLCRAKRRGLIDYSIDEMFEGLEISRKRFRKTVKEDCEEVFDEEETPLMMEYLKEHPDLVNLGILLLFVTGLRIGELVALKREDFEKDVIKVRRTETKFYDYEEKRFICRVDNAPKTEAGIRNVVIPKGYEWIIREILSKNRGTEFVFCKDGKRITAQAVRERMYRICNKMNLLRRSPHKIRKTYGTILLENVHNNKMVEAQMGHTDIICGERHYHRNRKSIEKKKDILSSIPDFTIATKTE